ncbi:hypothetical protein TKWG_24330 [Advenella kashmirensis WT001]|uniref:Uncharacterized protein n=1 Tax=Advenella kashmirensis (strain DSM 17095 / LMG 22695 / WT001) TaxID=1036672 RepID=I3UHE1_ADVKW|nr:hypothetical protein TKWG_24330 [Advenella kashmirensis WT001]
MDYRCIADHNAAVTRQETVKRAHLAGGTLYYFYYFNASAVIALTLVPNIGGHKKSPPDRILLFLTTDPGGDYSFRTRG